MQRAEDIREAIEAALRDSDLLLEYPQELAWLRFSDWDDFGELGRDQFVRIQGVDGPIYLAESYGGEGMGDMRWIVLKVGDRHFRKDGYYESHYGSSWGGDFEEVVSRPVTREEWFRVS